MGENTAGNVFDGYNLTTENCPVRDQSWPEKWPAFNQALGITLTLVHICALIACLTYVYKRRMKEPYRSRNVVLITVSSMGTLFLVVNLSLREFVGRDQWPCDVTLWSSYMAVFLWLSPVAVQLLQVKNRLEWQEKLSGVPVIRNRRNNDAFSDSENTDTDGSNDDTSVLTSFVWSKYRASHQRAYISMAFIFAVMLIFTLVYSFISPVYYHGCMGCDLSFVDFVLFSCTLLGCAIFLFVTAWRVPKPLQGQAKHPLVHQIRVMFFYYFPLYLSYLVLIIADPGGMHSGGKLSWNHLSSMILTSWLIYISAYPGIRVQWKKHTTAIRLINVIRDPVLLPLFENHLKAEFSLENLRFYFEATALRRQFPRGPGFAQREMEEWRLKALDVYNTFVASDGLLSLNLSSHTRREIEKGLGIAKRLTTGAPKKKKFDIEWGAMSSDLFDNAIHEVFKLMERDSFNRFCEQNKEVLEDQELTQSRAIGGSTSMKSFNKDEAEPRSRSSVTASASTRSRLSIGMIFKKSHSKTGHPLQDSVPTFMDEL